MIPKFNSLLTDIDTLYFLNQILNFITKFVIDGLMPEVVSRPIINTDFLCQEVPNKILVKRNDPGLGRVNSNMHYHYWS